MRTIILLAWGLMLSTHALHAQLPSISKDAVNAAANPGALVSQFTSALKPTSFTDAWSGGKTGFLGKAQKASNAISMASTISSLAGFIKPSLFKEGSSAGSILQTANTVKTMAEATGLLKSLEGGLKPEAFASGWSGQRSGWLSALSLLK